MTGVDGWCFLGMVSTPAAANATKRRPRLELLFTIAGIRSKLSRAAAVEGEANMERVLRIGMLLPILMLSACATNNATRAPDANLSKLKTFYVVRVPEDERGIEKLIAARLTAMGYQSASGDAPKPAAPVDGIVTYQDRWMWDITMYMIKLDIQIRDGTSGAILAKGEVMRPSLQRKSPEGMVEETLGVIFK